MRHLVFQKYFFRNPDNYQLCSVLLHEPIQTTFMQESPRHYLSLIRMTFFDWLLLQKIWKATKTSSKRVFIKMDLFQRVFTLFANQSVFCFAFVSHVPRQS